MAVPSAASEALAFVTDPEVPAGFGFSATQMVEAISGGWTDSTNGLSLTLAPAPGGEINYTTSAKGSNCASSISLDVVGEMSGAPLSTTNTAEGGFLAYQALRGGQLYLSLDPSYPTNNACSFIYYPADATTPDALVGECANGLSGPLSGLALSFSK